MAICSTSNFHLLFFVSFIFLGLLNHITASHYLQQQQRQEQKPEAVSFQSNQCGETCGSLQVPFPFYLNSSSSSSCGSIVVSDAFSLSCLQQHQKNTTAVSQLLFLNIGSQSYQVLQFFQDGVLVDYFPITTTSGSSTSCRPYNDLDAFRFEENDYFGISSDNVVGLYDCGDSSLCKLAADSCTVDTCDGTGSGSACCYPLSDGSSWRVGDGFSVFSQFGCRGFSSWVVPSSSSTPKRGVKLEWAIPKTSSKAKCSPNAYIVNATSVPSGVRCQCPSGFIGDAFVHGVGCFKPCLKDGRDAYGKNCVTIRHDRRKVKILVGIVASALSLASLTALFCLLKWTRKSNALIPDKDRHTQGAISFRKVSKSRLFAYDELEEATKGFDDGQKLVEGTKGTLYAGVLGDGLHVAVHKLQQCGGEESRDHLTQELSKLVEVLSAVPHRNLAHVLGCCIDTGSMSPLVVYEYPANGTMEEHLCHVSRVRAAAGLDLDWYQRLRIASETAGLLAFLQYEISPPIFHHDLQPGFIFLDHDYSVKIAGFVPLIENHSDSRLSYGMMNSTNNNFYSEGGGGSMLQFYSSDDVYSLGAVLVNIITGGGCFPATIALGKIRSGKLEEIIDPLLYYDEQPILRREQIEIVADLATRCFLFGGKLSMIDVARELMHLLKETSRVDGCSTSSRRRRREPALEETFSNSSLLQMISMSPDSIYVPPVLPN